MAYGIIYKATSPDGKVYVGQTTTTLAIRKSNHKYMALKGDRRSTFCIAILEHGFDNFTWEQIDTADNAADLDAKEKYWIAHYKADDPQYGYNTVEGGSAPKHTIETRKKISIAKKGRPNGREGKHHTAETKARLRNAHAGKIISLETRRKISEAKKGTNTGEKHHNAKLTETIVRQIKIELQAGARICDIAGKYNISRGVVKSIKYGKNWAWLKTA